MEDDQLIGRKFDGYEIIDEIGRGGMATVYKARQTSMNRLVAIKVLPRQFVHDPTFRARFEREVSIVASLEHRAIVPVHDYGELDELPYIVMRYMDSGSVDDLLSKGPLSAERVERVITQIADGLDYAHTRGIFHRDLKPSNILLDSTGDAYLTDFGIAYLAGSDKLTNSGVVGTPAYMSPEQAQGLTLDGRSDVYGLAVLAFEMLTGRRPYESDTPYSIAVMHVTAPVPSARDVYKGVSVAVDQVLRRGLAKNRAERFQTAAAFAQALAKAVHISPDEIASSTAQTRPVDTQESRRRLEEDEEIHVSAPLRPGEADPARAADPTPPSSARVNMLPLRKPRRQTPPPSREGGYVPPLPKSLRPRRPRPWWGNVLLGGAVGLLIFAVLTVILLLVLNAQPSPPEAAATATATVPASVDVTVVPQLQPLHPAAQALTATAEAPATDPLDDLAVNGGLIVFYAERDDEDAELYLLDLATGLEVQLTDNDAADIYPAVSPDGATVAFMSDRDGDSEIFLLDLACVEEDSGAACEETARQLTDNEVEDRTPAWTSDGEAVLYVSDVDFAGQYDLYRVPAGGGDPEALLETDTRLDHPSMAPDGAAIIFHDGAADDLESGAIRRLDLDSGDVTTLYDDDGSDWSPTYSPDGTQIAFHRQGDGRAALWVMDADGENTREVYDGPGYDWAAAWSPDGRLLAFSSDESGEQAVYLVDPAAETANGGARRITTGGGEYPAWVP